MRNTTSSFGAREICSAIGLVFLLMGCATMSGGGSRIVYNPKADARFSQATPMNGLEAKRAVADVLRKFHGSVSGNWILSADVGPGQFVLNYRPGPNTVAGAESHTYPFGAPEGMVVKLEAATRYYGAYHKNEGFCGWYELDNAVRFVTAVLALEKYFMVDHTAESDAELARFKPEAQDYLAKNPKPAIPEETRKFQIQAESAFDEKRYLDAIDFYSQGIAASPWWPEGHYNLALVLAKEGLLPDAVTEIRKYAALSTDPVATRRALDRQYAWEGKIKAALKQARGSSGAAPSSSAQQMPEDLRLLGGAILGQ